MSTHFSETPCIYISFVASTLGRSFVSKRNGLDDEEEEGNN